MNKLKYDIWLPNNTYLVLSNLTCPDEVWTTLVCSSHLYVEFLTLSTTERKMYIKHNVLARRNTIKRQSIKSHINWIEVDILTNCKFRNRTFCRLPGFLMHFLARLAQSKISLVCRGKNRNPFHTFKSPFYIGYRKF